MLVLALFTILLLLEVEAPVIVLRISQKTNGNRKTPYCLETQLLHLFLAQFHPGKAMTQPLLYKINYSGSYRPFKPKKLQLIKIRIFTLYYSNECHIMVQITKPLAWVSSVDLSGHFDYPCAHFYQLNVEDFVVEIHHGDFFLFFISCQKQQKITSHAIHPVKGLSTKYKRR